MAEEQNGDFFFITSSYFRKVFPAFIEFPGLIIFTCFRSNFMQKGDTTYIC